MRILHVQKVKGIAGSENHLLALLPGLQALGHEVSMLVMEAPDQDASSFVRALQAKGVPTSTMPLSRDFSPMAVIGLVRQLRRQPVDLVHTHLAHADFHAGLAAKLAGLDFIVSTRHNTFPPFSKFPLKLLNNLVSRVFDRIICISHNVARFVAKNDPGSASKLEVIHYGLTPSDLTLTPEASSLFRKTEDEVVVGIVARLIPEKDYPTLLHGMRLLADQHPQARLVIIGDGPLGGQLEQLARSLGLASRVDFLGYRDQAARLMQGLDIFAFTSRVEGFGLVLLEAMDAGLPVVATRIASLPEIVKDGETGFLVPPGDAKSLAEALSALIRDRDLAHRLGLAGRERLRRHFSVRAMVCQTDELYRQLGG